MSKTAAEMQSLLDDPDSLDMEDEDAILALANDSDIPDEAESQIATDEVDTKKVDTSASDSTDAEKDDGVKDGLTDDDIKAPVKSRDGEHTIPYQVLGNTRESLKTANTQLEVTNKELTEQKAENARLQARIDNGEAGGDTDSVHDGSDNDSSPETIEEEFTAKNGMSSEEFKKEYGEGLTKSLLSQAEESLENRQQLGVLMKERNQRVEVEEITEGDSLQGDIDAVPELAALQAEGGEKWQDAIDTDNALKMMPKYRDISRSERFKAVAEELELKVPEKAGKKTDTSKYENADDDLPTSLSDFPGGSPASQSDKQTMETMDSADVGLMFADMNQKQQDDYLNNL